MIDGVIIIFMTIKSVVCSSYLYRSYSLFYHLLLYLHYSSLTTDSNIDQYFSYCLFKLPLRALWINIKPQTKLQTLLTLTISHFCTPYMVSETKDGINTLSLPVFYYSVSLPWHSLHVFNTSSLTTPVNCSEVRKTSNKPSMLFILFVK